MYLTLYPTDCEMNIHKACLRTVEEQCVGAIPRRGGDKISNLMAKIRPEQRKKTGGSFNLGQSKWTRGGGGFVSEVKGRVVRRSLK